MTAARITRRPATRVAVGAPAALAFLVLALAVPRPEFAVAAVGPLLLVLAALGRPPPRPPRVRAAVSPARAVEGDEASWSVTLEGLPPSAEVTVLLDLPDRLHVARATPTTVPAGTPALVVDVPVTCDGWGAHRLRVVEVTVVTPGWTVATRVGHGTPLTVLPEPARLRAMVGTRLTQPATGVHPSTARGAGLEFADLRRFAVGDRPRAINWRVTARTGDLWVNERHPDRSADVIIVLDTTDAAARASTVTLDAAVRAAAGVADVVLRRRDRVGYVGIGGVVRWLTAGPGLRQWYRLAHTLVGERPAPAHPGLGVRLLPPAVLPPDALVVALSPLLDQRFVTALTDLHHRGNDVAVVELDPLAGVQVPPTPTWQLAAWLFALDRERQRARLAALGIVVVPWAAGTAFTRAVAELIAARRRTRPAQRGVQP